MQEAFSLLGKRLILSVHKQFFDYFVVAFLLQGLYRCVGEGLGEGLGEGRSLTTPLTRVMV